MGRRHALAVAEVAPLSGGHNPVTISIESVVSVCYKNARAEEIRGLPVTELLEK